MAATATLPETALPTADGSRDEDEEAAEQCRISRLPSEAGLPICGCIRFINDGCRIPKALIRTYEDVVAGDQSPTWRDVINSYA